MSRVLVTSEMDSKGLPVSGLESEGQLAPFPPLMIPPRVGAEGGGGGAEGGTRRCCCWCCCPARCPCRPLSPLFPQLTGACGARALVVRGGDGGKDSTGSGGGVALLAIPRSPCPRARGLDASARIR